MGGGRLKLAASMIIRNELRRYLEPCIDHLLAFCDIVAVVDDGSDDDALEWFVKQDERVHCYSYEHPRFYEHEGKARQVLIDWTMKFHPTHVLSLDADEFVNDGAKLRRALEEDPKQAVWSLQMEEIWKANTHLFSREDGGHRTHAVPFLWKAPPAGERWTMRDRKLACGRIPTQVLGQGRAKPVGASILHFGWANPAERRKRIDRYKQHDGGKFHASSHLRSLEWPEVRMRLRQRPWPEGEVFGALRDRFAAVNA